MKRPPLPYLLLLPLLAVLLFGNCAGNVRSMLNQMDSKRRSALRASVVQRQAARAVARKQLHGPEREAAYQRIEQIANRQADSILRNGTSTEHAKFANRRNKLERQLLHDYRGPITKYGK